MAHKQNNIFRTDEYMTPAQLAALTGMRLQTLAAWRCRGGGPPFTRLGSAIRYSRTAVNDWLASRTGNSTAQLDAALA